MVMGWDKWLFEAGELLQVLKKRDAFFSLVLVLPVIYFILLEGTGEVTQLTDKGFGREGHQPCFSCLCRAVLPPFLAFLYPERDDALSLSLSHIALYIYGFHLSHPILVNISSIYVVYAIVAPSYFGVSKSVSSAMPHLL